MHHYPEDQSNENLDKIRRFNVCVECGRQLALYIGAEGKIYIACSGQVHEGITREYKPPREDYESNIRRSVELEQKVGTESTRALAKLPRQGQLTQPEAEHILSLVYPGCPKDEVIRCAILCRDFGLHPLMKEVYLIPFETKGGTKNWATVLGINATRKLMALRGTYSYFDDTPRLMTSDEQMRIFGVVDGDNIVAITKLRTKDGLEAPGYGRWPKGKEPYGTDKGNTKANMAFIRSERNAFGRLSPDALPEGVEVIDEAYVEVPDVGKVDPETGEVIEGEFKELEPDEKPKSQAKKTPEPKPEPEPEPESTPPAELDETPIDDEQLKHIYTLMEANSMDLSAMSKYCLKDKGWEIRKLGGLVKWQYDVICKAFEKGQ